MSGADIQSTGLDVGEECTRPKMKRLGYKHYAITVTSKVKRSKSLSLGSSLVALSSECYLQYHQGKIGTTPIMIHEE
eukprot:scaffold1032_cov129-Skeletonema_dohrnii-CCMP3373.AAC.5